MKRIIALLMVALIAVSLAACVPTPGDLSNIVNNAIQNEIENQIEDNGEGLDIQIGTESDDTDVDVDINNDDAVQETVTIDMGTITQQVIVDSNGIKITVEEISYEEYYGPQISFLIENSSDKNVYVSTSIVVVNNITLSNYFSANVNAGKKIYENMRFYEDDLKNVGITELGTVEFKLSICEEDNYTEIFATDMIKLVLNDKVDLNRQPKGEQLFSKNGITVYNEECTKTDDEFYDYVTRFFIVNTSDADITLRLEDISANGFMVNAYCSATVPAGKMAYADFYFYKSDLETSKITEIEEVEFCFDIYNSKTYDNIAKSDTIKINTK